MHLPIEALKPMQVMVRSTFIVLQNPFVFKDQVNKEKYEKFLNPIHQRNVLYIGLPVEKSILF